MSEIDEGVEIPAPARAFPPEWQPLPPAAATTAMFGGAALGLLLGAGPALGGGIPIAMRAFDLEGWQILVVVAIVWLAVIAVGTLIAYRRWKSTCWKLDDTGLHLRRGRMWRKEVLVPRSRVQHLDIERGPIERRYELATLIVHTAGTRQHALRIAGLPDADAVALRDALVPDSSQHDDVL
jgi:membrane protein YdbS with pleckstrin-like domain